MIHQGPRSTLCLCGWHWHTQITFLHLAQPPMPQGPSADRLVAAGRPS